MRNTEIVLDVIDLSIVIIILDSHKTWLQVFGVPACQLHPKNNEGEDSHALTWGRRGVRWLNCQVLQETCEAPDGSQDRAHRQVERQHKIKHQTLNFITFLYQEYN